MEPAAGSPAPATGCYRCGGAATLVPETWSGKYQSACTHAACAGCLAVRVDQELARCRLEGQLRVGCGAPGCRRMLPQTLVFHVSAAARGLALLIDKQEGNLTARDMALPMDWSFKRCEVCRDYAGPTLRLDGCGHQACEACWGRWVSVQVPRCRARRQVVAFRCLGEGCTQALPRRLARLVSEDVRVLERQMASRRRLQENRLYPLAVQVDCPAPGCVGLGYLGFDTVMCFICEHQWSAVGDAPADGLAANLKQCPRCRSQIEKNGGCDHMTCRCGFEFWWSTLQPFHADGRAAQPDAEQQQQQHQHQQRHQQQHQQQQHQQQQHHQQHHQQQHQQHQQQQHQHQQQQDDVQPAQQQRPQQDEQQQLDAQLAQQAAPEPVQEIMPEPTSPITHVLCRAVSA